MSDTDDPRRERIARSLEKQRALTALGAELLEVDEGRVVLGLTLRDDHVQQHGFAHAGVIATIGDSAAGYAALTLAPEGAAVLTVQFQIHLLRPAQGPRFEARGRVIRAGRSLSTVESSVVELADGSEREVARLTGTIAVREGTGLVD